MPTRLPPRASNETDAAYVDRLILFELKHEYKNCVSDKNLRKIRHRLLHFFHPDSRKEKEKDIDDKNRAIDEVMKRLDHTMYPFWKSHALVEEEVEGDCDDAWMESIPAYVDRLFDVFCDALDAASDAASSGKSTTPSRKKKTFAQSEAEEKTVDDDTRDDVMPSWGKKEMIDVYDEQRKGWIHRTVKEQIGRVVYLLSTEDLPNSCDVSCTRRRTLCSQHVGGKSKRSFDNFSCSLACDHPGECLRPIVTDKRKRFATGLPFDADIKADIITRFSDKIATYVLTTHKSNTVVPYKRFFRAILFGEHSTLSIHVPKCDNDSFVKNIFRLWGDSFEKWSKKTIPETDRRNAFDRGNGHAVLGNIFKAGEERVQSLFEQSILEAQL